MKSTGEVMGIDESFEVAFYKSQIGANVLLPKTGNVFISIKDEDKEKIQKDVSGKGLKGALITIIIADISMSLDNVIAITAIARDNKTLLVLGIAFAILIMALFATAIVKLLTKFKWLSYLGLAFLVYLSSKMTLDGWLQIYPYINDYL